MTFSNKWKVSFNKSLYRGFLKIGNLGQKGCKDFINNRNVITFISNIHAYYKPLLGKRWFVLKKKTVLFTVLFKLCVGAEIVQIPLSHENGRIDVQYLKEKLGKH
jgi:hypothetical protein